MGILTGRTFQDRDAAPNIQTLLPRPSKKNVRIDMDVDTTPATFMGLRITHNSGRTFIIQSPTSSATLARSPSGNGLKAQHDIAKITHGCRHCTTDANVREHRPDRKISSPLKPTWSNMKRRK